MALTLMSIVSQASIPKSLVVEGKVIKSSVVSYDLYVMKDDSSYSLIESKAVHKYFSIQVFSGATYLIRFTSEDGDSTTVKYLLVKPEKKDDFLVNVDFSNDDSAELYWHSGGTYMIRPYDPGSLKLSGNDGSNTRISYLH